MGTTHRIIRITILGISLAVLTIPFFHAPLTIPHFPESESYDPLEFSDVRIVTLDLSVPYSDPDLIHRMTIHADDSFNWCSQVSSQEPFCRNELWDERHAQLWKHLMTLQGIPSL